MSRFREILYDSQISAVELLLTLEGVAFIGGLLVTGGDQTTRQILTEVRSYLPFVQSGRLLTSVLLVIALLRLYAVIWGRPNLRRWLARFFSFMWLMVLLPHIATGVFANSLPLFALYTAANLWVQTRLDEAQFLHMRTINQLKME